MKSLVTIKRYLSKYWSPLTVILVFFVFYSFHSILRHADFQTQSWDLGIFDQQVWLYSHTFSAYNTVRGTNLFSDHFSPFLIFLAPFYRMFPHPETLLVLQALAMALAAVPLYLIGHKVTHSRTLAMIIMIAFLLSNGVQAAIDFDFHTEPFAVLFISWFVWLWFKKNFKWAFLLAILAMLTKEDVPLYFIGIAVSTLLFLPFREIEPSELGKSGLNRWMHRYQQHKIELKAAAWLLVFSIISFGVIMIGIHFVPHTDANFNYFTFNMLGTGYRSATIFALKHPAQAINIIWHSFIDNPIKVQTATIYLTSFLFLPLLRPDILLFALPFYINKFISDRPVQWPTAGQYSPVGMLIFALATIYSTQLIVGRSHRYKQLAGGIIGGLLLIAMATNIPAMPEQGRPNQFLLTLFDQKRIEQINQYDGLRDLINQIPAGASVVTENQIVPHLSNRQKIYLLRCPFCNLPTPLSYDFVLLDTRFSAGFEPTGQPPTELINELKDQGTFEGWGRFVLVGSTTGPNNAISYLFKQIR